MQRVAPTLATAAAAGALAALAGCGGSGGGSTSTAAPAPKPSATKPPTATASKHVTVSIKDFDYSPRRITVARGASVSWTNKDSANHTVTFDKSGKDLGNQQTGSTKHFTFTKAGTFAYHCDFHPNMHGRVVVK